MSVRRAARFPRPVSAGLIVMALGLLVSGCSEIEESSAAVYQPAKVEAVGDSEVKRVTFTPAGAARVDLQTATAQQSGRHTVIPYAALIYDSQGTPWVYTSPRALTFSRTRVAVERIEGDRVLLAAGLRRGTRVVTVGAAEVYGAELDIAGGH
jgi:hypothetical protein